MTDYTLAPEETLIEITEPVPQTNALNFKKHKISFWAYLFITVFVVSAIYGSELPGFPLRYFAVISFLTIVFRALYDVEAEFRFYNTITCSDRIWKAVLISAGVILLWSLVTMLWATSRIATAQGILIWVCELGCIIMAGEFIRGKKRAIFAAQIYTIILVITCIIGIYESFTADYIKANIKEVSNIYASTNMFGLHRPYAHFYNINNYATFVQLGMPMVFIATSDMKWKGIINIIIMALAEAVILLGGSNTAMIIFAITFTLYVYMNRKSMLTWVLVFAVILAIISFSSILFELFSDVLSKNLYAQESQPRWQIWENILQVCKEYHYMGISPNNSENLEFFVFGQAHNYFLSIFQDLGIIGITAYMYMFFSFLKNTFTIYRKGWGEATKYCLMFLIIFPMSTMCMAKMFGHYFYWMEFGIIYSYIKGVEEEKILMLQELAT